ncbi:hypothetical protein L288_08760 [Sphingobium quisquiliarum P25]|uniref:Uncharacterized protein n=1 Tax=Sphingobium quisquiliarum P25 TaxID=1329909 RepID=T0I8U2_9SPHN|nr:hypothetical protein L288_08760 [Sphingobium quisquiliarum P25]
MDGIVHGLRAITDIMAQTDGVEGAMLLGDGSVATFGLRLAHLTHANDQSIISLDRGKGQSAGPADIGARGGRRIVVLDRLVTLVERDDEFVARTGNGLQESELLAKPAMIGIFLDLREIFRVPAPAIGQGGGCRDIIDMFPQEYRAVIGNGLDRGAVDHAVGGAAPGISGVGQQCQDGG